MAPRITYRRQNSYNTRSNKIRKVKTPGFRGNVNAQYPNKRTNPTVCSETKCRVALNGIPRVRPQNLPSLARRNRRVSRPYGGNLCHQCLRERIVRAFLVEEVKIVKKIMGQ